MNDMRLEIQRKQRRTGLAPEMIARDMMQARILSAMVDTVARRELALKGGLALRHQYRSHRFTKDIDFQTGPEIPMSRIKTIVESSVKVAAGAGILENVVVTAPKQTDTVQRWKVNGDIVGGGSHVSLTLEVSRRGMPDPKLVSAFVEAPTGDGGTKMVHFEVYSPQAIALTKVDCLLNPNRTAARDVFDLFLLVTMKVSPPIEMLRQLGKDALVQGMKDAWAKLDLMTWDVARTDLVPFISTDEGPALTEDAWNEMVYRTGEAVEEWLQKALDEEEASLQPMGMTH